MRSNLNYKFLGVSLIVLFFFIPSEMYAQDMEEYVTYRGEVVNLVTNDALESVTIMVQNSNISTITNSEGDFVLKIPSEYLNSSVLISHLGYRSKEIRIEDLSEENNKIELTTKITDLSAISLLSYTDPEALVRAVFDRKKANNPSEPTVMTAFYRETIKRRNRNVSLTEAVVNLYKQPYTNKSKDIVALNKARKSTDYRRLDTVTVKLQGGPYSTLYLDIMKYPEYIFTPASIGDYKFNFIAPSAINGRPVYVVNFTQLETILEPLYKGTLYIDAETLALTNAYYSLNLSKTRDIENIFVKKKPRDVTVTPTVASYRVDYSEKDNKWQYNYGSVELSFKVAKRGKLFNQVYTLSAEMAVTDWQQNTTGFMGQPENRLKPTVVMVDAVSGFTDPDFWGPYNLIEPEKSIESAINKIKRKLNREKDKV